jgi:hypothetical protein
LDLFSGNVKGADHSMADTLAIEDERLLHLTAAVLGEVEQYGACSLGDKVALKRLNDSIQEKLAAMRAAMRDLELLVEEVDR